MQLTYDGQKSHKSNKKNKQKYLQTVKHKNLEKSRFQPAITNVQKTDQDANQSSSKANSALQWVSKLRQDTVIAQVADT